MRDNSPAAEKKCATCVLGRGNAPEVPVLMECVGRRKPVAEWLSPDEERRLRPESFRLIGGKYYAESIVVSPSESMSDNRG